VHPRAAAPLHDLFRVLLERLCGKTPFEDLAAQATLAELLARIAAAWDSPRRDAVAAEVYPGLDKISVDYAVMEPASRDTAVKVAALAMPLRWLDVGSWATFAKTCPGEGAGNAVAGARALLEESSGTLVVSNDPEHLGAAIGCEGLIIVHTPDATLVCRADRAEALKALQQKIAERFGGKYL
jgi:mannose-1-phosphate guanylyltransferase